MSCASSTLKFTLFILNILCFIVGVLTLLACTYALIEFDGSEAIKIPCILGIVLSSILFLNSILGCCGITRQSIRITWIYAIVMLLLLLGQIAVIFLEPVNFSNIANEIINNVWNSDMANDYKMTMYEMKYECCGKFGPDDYVKEGHTIPLSCYQNNNNTLATNLFTEGCATKLAEMYSLNQRIEEISDWTLVGLEGASALVAAILAISLKHIQRRKLYH
ncbi:protein late bloomer [Lucilia sericata]|uniref:protein late bloomer n=1 Tax=Lucilia sericata TaxID=13632 RepID=UPI0018A8038F|nr:protein late bloomer [Lucilia sericata]